LSENEGSPLSVIGVSLDIFESFSLKMNKKQLHVLKNKHNINLKTFLITDLTSDDLFIKYTSDVLPEE
jgi:hypothetical protein